jgi:hypothetical protein
MLVRELDTPHGNAFEKVQQKFLKGWLDKTRAPAPTIHIQGVRCQSPNPRTDNRARTYFEASHGSH